MVDRVARSFSEGEDDDDDDDDDDEPPLMVVGSGVEGDEINVVDIFVDFDVVVVASSASVAPK